MKAIVYTAYGPPDVLRLEEIDRPTPEDNEVLIRVQAASVNSWDWDLLIGTPQGRLGGPFKPQYEVLGADVAGRVEATGRGVTRFRPGDEVFGDLCASGWGGLAEFVCAREDALAPKPPSLTFEQAAAVPQAGVLALQGLRRGEIQAGESVLINGAGGGVGTFAVQMARSYGAEVTGVDSAEKLDTVRSIGADHVIDYAHEDFTQSGRLYDLILDVVARRSLFDYRRALAREGVYVMVGGNTIRILQMLVLERWAARVGDRRLRLLMHEPNSEDLVRLTEMIEERRIAPVLAGRFPLSEAAEALRFFGSGRATGKVVVTMEQGVEP